jgi:Spore cortex protein YabQ (Spore_YabQ).
MSQDIINEVYFLGGSVFMGIVITFVYDFILIGRQVVRHGLFAVSLEDLVFWLACAVSVFYMLYEENNGVLRWFAVAGAAVGMLLYKRIMGKKFVRIMSAVLLKEIHILRKTAGFLFRPFRWLMRKIRVLFCFFRRREKRLCKYVKKKLTGAAKALKILLHKH